MKKLYIILCAALALAACGKMAPENGVDETLSGIPVSDIVFDFTVKYPGETKAVKGGWESGDKVFVFFEDVTTGYVTMSYGSSGWDAPAFNGTASVSDLTESGKKLTAVYLPFGSRATASYDSGWKFSTTYYSYYMRAEKVDYTVSTAGGITTLSATLDMVNPDGYVQFFVEDADAVDGAYTLGTDAVIPVGVASIAADGSVVETSDKVAGDDMVGYAYQGGYLFSGKLTSWSYGANYYFAKTKVADGSRADYFAQPANALASHSAVKLPANDNVYVVQYDAPNTGKWIPVGSTITVTLYRVSGTPQMEMVFPLGTWFTCNYGQSVPEALGTLYSFDNANALGVSLPTKDQFESINDSRFCSYIWLKVHGQQGVVIKADRGFLFLPAQLESRGYYWSSTEDVFHHDGYLLYFDDSGGRILDRNYRSDEYAVRPFQN